MTIEEAFKELTESQVYKEICKRRDAEGTRYRVYLSRFKKDKLTIGSMVEMLLANDYIIKANRATKKKTKYE